MEKKEQNDVILTEFSSFLWNRDENIHKIFRVCMKNGNIETAREFKSVNNYLSMTDVIHVKSNKSPYEAPNNDNRRDVLCVYQKFKGKLLITCFRTRRRIT